MIAQPLPVPAASPLNAAIARHWVTGANILLGIWAGLPWLAALFAKLGWWAGANAVYTGFIFFCHQLPERAGRLADYEAASCYRCLALYGAMFLTGLLFAYSRRAGHAWVRRGISWQGLLLCCLPILLDGLTHMMGLRADNAWFDLLTGGVFGAFSMGDGIGTLNWWLRVLSATLCGVGAILFFYPRIDRTLAHDLLGGPVSAAPPPVRDATRA